MTSRYYLGIDTSNYTTSLALCDDKGKIAFNFKKLLPVPMGECGLRQSDAVFAHIKQIPEAADALRCFLSKSGGRIAAVGYSRFPRDIEGSYMPCFLAGESAATTVAAAISAPLYAFSHQAGHIRAALYSSQSEHLISSDKKFAAMHLSGGTTEILLVTPSADSFDIKLIGRTLDISAGQAIDRAGVMMGMQFPAGRFMEIEAEKFQGKIHRPKLSVNGLNLNLSGVENIAKKLYSEGRSVSETAAFVIDFIARSIKKVSDNLTSQYGDIAIVYSGGVMSCRIIKNLLQGELRYFAEPEFSSDNAAGTALLTRDRFLKSADLS